jgi:hypothetical protein
MTGTGGATSAENLAPACRRDHLLKTHAGWQYDRPDNGTWTTPTGHRSPNRTANPNRPQSRTGNRKRTTLRRSEPGP